MISTPSGSPLQVSPRSSRRFPGGDEHESDNAHLVQLPSTEWTVWRDAVLRTTGFPAEGLDRFASPELAAVADSYLDGTASLGDLEAAHAAALADADRETAAIAADPLFREAVTWQNPASAPDPAAAAEAARPLHHDRQLLAALLRQERHHRVLRSGELGDARPG